MIDTAMTDSDLLARIPGECVGHAAQSLPPADTTADTFRDAVVQLPDRRRVVITFRRLSHRHGCSRHWFWSATRAVPADTEGSTNASASIGDAMNQPR